jgi:cyanophycinase-like exopeptidase
MRYLLLTAALAGLWTAAEKPYEYFHAGSDSPVKVQTNPGFLLAGGGNTPEEAYRWFVAKAGGGDAVTIRASGGGAMNQVLLDAGKLNSASTFLFKSRDAASDPFVVNKIRNAAALFIAGGDQWNYFKFWKGTPVGEALNESVKKGVPIGGTSAGLAVLGEYSFSAEHDTVTSKQALANPFDYGLTIGEDFIHIPLLKGIITDTHWVRRDRLGRTLAFLARLLHDGKAAPVESIAVDQDNAVLLEGDGSASMAGPTAAYFLRAAEPPQICQPGKPLTFRNVSVYRIQSGGKFNVKTWRGEGGTAYSLSVEEGVVKSTQPGGGIY